jgi:ribosomal protein L11 methylase PrmA
LLTHLHLHARSQKHYADRPLNKEKIKKQVTKKNLIQLIESLKQCIKALSPYKNSTEWQDYYDSTNYTKYAFQEKLAIVETFIEMVNPRIIWDLGANTGEFSRLASSKQIFTVGFDFDPGAVDKNYLNTHRNQDFYNLPLLMDLTNPSPGLGWKHKERKSLLDRGPVDMVLALALVHHLAISNNLPFEKLAEFFREITTYLIIEFIPKTDSQVKRLLQSRNDIFKDYNTKCFEMSFEQFFSIKGKKSLPNSERIIYLMKKID